MASGTYRDGKRRFLHFIATAIGIILLITVIGECILRFALGLGNPILIQADSACGYFLKPDQDVTRFFVHTHVNHDGMRSDEVRTVHEPGTVRLLFVGDSITYGTTRVDQSAIFTEILHRDLPAVMNQPVEVLNASAGAWAPDNELSFLESRGIFGADLVLLVLNDGDLTQPRATIAEVGDDLPQRRPATALGELYTRYLSPKVAHWMKRRDAGDSVSKEAYEVTEENIADLDKIHQLVINHGARLIVVFIPFRKDIPKESKEPESILETWTKSRHVGMFDLTTAEMPYSLEDITLDTGVHFNAKGNRILAQAIERDWPRVVGIH